MPSLRVMGVWTVPLKLGSDFASSLEVGGARAVRHETRIGHLSDNAAALSVLLQSLPRHTPVVDLCAGVGIWAAVLQGSLKPGVLILNDSDSGCRAQLAYAYPRARVTGLDCFEAMGAATPGAVVCLDLTICTAFLVLGGEADAFRLLFDSRPAAVVMSDCAAPRFHLNGPAYAKVLGRPASALISYSDYLRAYAAVLSECFGYSCTDVVRCGLGARPHSAYLLLRPAAHLHPRSGQPPRERRLPKTDVLEYLPDP